MISVVIPALNEEEPIAAVVRACRARSSVTPRRGYDTRSSFTRPLGCAIGAAVINDNHFLGHAGREAFANHAGNRFLLV